jgi:TRAP-type C4-dicarboxylate transport system permease small subunit
MKATKVHIAINVLCFITIIISLYFGMSIFNANDNQHITHLNNFDNYTYYDIKDITVLTAQAVIISSVFLLTAFGLQIYSYFISKTKRKKRITLGLLTIYLILFFFSIFVMFDIETRDFYHYGMIWVLLSLTLIFANSVLIFLKRI